VQVGAAEDVERLLEGDDRLPTGGGHHEAGPDAPDREARVAEERERLESARRDAAPAGFLVVVPRLEQDHLEAGLGEAPGALGPAGPPADDRHAPHGAIIAKVLTGRRPPHVKWKVMRQALGKVLELAGMLTLGMALFVYGLGEQDMSAELGWLLVGSVVFLVGFLMERRPSRDG
jgi:hypothetical protein